MMMRIVEVEPAPCQHLHSSNYDYTAVIHGEPVRELPDGQHRCFDCGVIYTPQVPPRKYTLEQIEILAHEFIGEPEIDNYERRLLLSIFVQWLAKREREGLEAK